MKCIESKLSGLSSDLGKLILRLTIGGLMLFHGWAKIVGGIAGIKYLTVKAGLPEFFAYGVYLGEVLFPIMIVLGIFVRTSALFLALTMVAAIFLAHSHEIFALSKTGGPVIELALIYLLGSISIMFIGSGKYSLKA
ncbi:DoxX family protein [Arcobacter porcinus]|uniref:DoxX n=1 Tax=Arcobacter porcinus TaxID=1935204 RepID=A0ABX2YBF7_9BACT|nr:DoxX family protein [Arcobacter porcinus]OCL84124.1 DoxX [Arcobacter porcinus]OCL84648.1 DoxX [Arcobacter porcinus]OCL89188.1 DoxX [Arcobacter porcinus]OCL91608.1 DoxX [Arcobacter porcinus]